MNRFSESFYTTDFDQEMLDFVESEYGGENPKSERTITHSILAYGGGVDSFWTEDIDTPNSYSKQGYVLLTKQEFKEKVGMPLDNHVEEGTFGKKDLVDGMFVKTREGEIHVVIGGCAHDNTGYVDLDNEFEEDLTDNLGNSDLDIVEVFVKEKNYSLIKHFNGVGLVSIWKRTPPKSEKVIKLEKLILLYEEQLEATKKLLAEELTL